MESDNVGGDTTAGINNALEGLNLESSYRYGNHSADPYSSKDSDNYLYSNNESAHASSGFGSIPLQPGELLPGEEHGYERSLSAPPPPGFGSSATERNRLASEILWGAGHQQQYQPAHHQHAGELIDKNNNNHNSSISNLGDVLGYGLAESIENSTQDKTHNVSVDDLNLHRQTRHAASRLIGSSTTSSNFSGGSDYASHNGSGLLGGNAASAGHGNAQQSAANNAINTIGSNNNDNHHYAFSRAPGSSDAQLRNDSNAFDFPSMFSSPLRDEESRLQEQREALRGSTTPVQMFAGHVGARRALPSRDVGMAVREPGNSEHDTGNNNNNFHSHSNLVDSQQKAQSLWGGAREFLPSSNSQLNNANVAARALPVTNFREFVPSSAGNQQIASMMNTREFIPSNSRAQSATAANMMDQSDANSSLSGGTTELSSRQAEIELRPFLWDLDRNQPSRTLAILHCSWLRVPDVRSSCETFGVLESFRAEFSSRGIFFVSYYDIRSAQYAAVELEAVLQRLAIVQGSNEEVMVRYCLPLNSSSQFDESSITITDLPDEIDENMLATMLSTYGVVRSIISQGPQAYVVEFQNLQDAKLAMLEIESSQPYGPNVNVEVGLRNPMERKRGRELLSTIAKWRQALGVRQTVNPPQQPQQVKSYAPTGYTNDSWRGPRQQKPDYGQVNRPQETTQLVLGPDGRYMQVTIPNNFSQTTFTELRQPQTQQQILQGPNGQLFIATMPVHNSNQVFLPSNSTVQQAFPATVVGNSTFADSRRDSRSNYFQVVPADATSVSGLSGRSYRSTQSSHHEDRDNRHLTLDVDAVEHGLDTRTSLMVRNIPNKYTQHMLLSEFAENGHGPGVIDFFYLPIDFKNRCNRGYAFINFVDHKDILSFHRRYFGKHWRTFNSDKICDITYARIQGKAAMLKRFENSALMEKDEEYKPLVFVSDGPEKGKRLPFPEPSIRMP